jgi:hypothetical protein
MNDPRKSEKKAEPVAPTEASVRRKLERGQNLTPKEQQLAVSNPSLAAIIAAIRRRNQ